MNKGILERAYIIISMALVGISLCACASSKKIINDTTEIISQKQYEIKEDITADQLDDLIYTLTMRAENYTSEAEVTYIKDDTEKYIITIKLPGVSDKSVFEDIISRKDIEFITNYNSDNQKTEITGKDIETASAVVKNNEYCIDIQLTEEGGQKFAEVTVNSIGKNIAICYGGELISNPTIMSAITTGEVYISNFSTYEEAENLARLINSGVVRYTLIEE